MKAVRNIGVRAGLVFVVVGLLVTPAAAQTVPFKGQAVGQDVSVSFESTGIHIVAQASGNGTGLGKFAETLDYMLSYDLIHFSGSARITAADGSKMFLAFSGQIPGFADAVFPLSYTGTFVLTGGTGRFQGVGGSGDLDGIDYGGGLFALAFAGHRTVGAKNP